ncbi:poly(A) RNA polymerase GLD2 isoform X2 [Phyllopteryx taeniolatus]|uniref:poly(A) RNA polymerase GLD2 isoform X2 n=1 Tax=Phyllopteryx taeniolatus TaxID=161469 RepID=UPI002AD3021D|nr:poly(A) RNA polymerase GLD2 isoform X2 [Phyllopteryx taeniolatus]
MFPHGASPRRRPAYNPRPYHAPAQVDPPFFQHRAVDGYDVPVHDSLPIYDWKPRPLAPPPPPHIMENWRKRKHEDHDSPIVKRLRGDASSSLPSSRHPVSRHTHPSFSPDHAVAGSSRSSSVFSHPHSHVHPHVPAIPRSSTNMHFFADDKLSAQVMKLFEMCQQQSSDLCQKEKCRSWLQRDERVSEKKSRSHCCTLCPPKDYEVNDLCGADAADQSQSADPQVPRKRQVSNLVFDLNVNNTVGIRNTFLLKSYAYVEPRIRPLIVVIKKWARHHQINDASQGTLSSYALVLMVLHYLQTLKEPVLPSLQMDFPECFDPSLEIDRIPEAAKNIPRYNSQNQSSLGTLLLGFLRYYATEFSWKKSVISVRAGKALPKQNHPKWNDKLICVEEPFERKNVARAVFKQAKFDAIKSQFLESWQILWKEMDLNSILPVQDIIEEETSWK